MRLLLLMLLLLHTCCAFAQPEQRRAQRKYHKALKLKARKQEDRACRAMEKIIRRFPKYEPVYSTLGEWYFTTGRYSQAATVFELAGRRLPGAKARYAYPLARSLTFGAHPDEALRLIDAYGRQGEAWLQLRTQAGRLRQAMANALPDTLIQPLPAWRVNTEHAETYPSISADGQSLYFTRNTNGVDQDFYMAVPDTLCGGWLAARPLPYPLNTPQQEAAQMISADQHYLFFMRCDNRSPRGWSHGGCDLYMAYTPAPDSAWSVPQSFGLTINTPGYEGTPCLSADNRELFFASGREGGYGGLDIWMSRFEHGLWQPPQNLGPAVNTAGDESAPFLAGDQKTLLFASSGRGSLGGSDLYISRRTGDTSWSAAAALPYPINTPHDELGICLSADGSRAIFSSDRNGPAGNYDLFELPWPDELKPEPMVYVHGYVYDSISKERLTYASILLSDAHTGDERAHYTSNRGDGSFMLALPLHARYAVQADRIGYEGLQDTLYFDRPPDTAAAHAYRVALLPYGYQRPISDTLVLQLHFARNATTLTDSMRSLIQAALQPWLAEAGIEIMVNGYTDNSGTPMINEQLSYLRSGLVADVLQAMGFAPGYIRWQGWGEANPLMPNDTDELRDMNRRVEVVIRR